MRDNVPRRKLGGTGEEISIIGVGGSHIGKPDLAEEAAVRILRTAIDSGVNFVDNSWDYNSGASDIRIGRALQDGYRHRVLLMSKVDGRTKAEARSQLEESLRRMKVDPIDLLQHHEVIRYEDANRIFAEGGAMEAFLEAREEGKIRYIGFTGHKDPHIHLHMLDLAARRGIRFDAVQMPLNVMDAQYRSFEQLVLPRLVAEGIGVIGMKSMGGGLILASRLVSAKDCLRYTLTLPVSTLVTGIDSEEILQQALDVVSNFRPLSDEEKGTMLRKTAGAAAEGHYELFKTSMHFDQTAKHPEWLGGDPVFVKELINA